MANLKAANPVKLIAKVLWKNIEALQTAEYAMIREWGPIDYRGEDSDCPEGGFYHNEMGSGLKRKLISFRDLQPPERLKEFRLKFNKIELSCSFGGSRLINLDPGILDAHKIVFASAKESPHKIYLGSGVYAEISALFDGVQYQPSEWTSADIHTGNFDPEFLEIRGRYLEERQSRS